MEKFICLSEKRSLEDCTAVSEACLGEMQSEADVEDIIQSVASEVAEAAAEQRGGGVADGDLTIKIQVGVVKLDMTHLLDFRMNLSI